MHVTPPKFSEGQFIMTHGTTYRINGVGSKYYSLWCVSGILSRYIRADGLITVIDEQAVLIYTDVDFYKDILGINEEG